MMVDPTGGLVTKDTQLIKPKKMRIGASGEFACPGHEELPRHPDSHVKNTPLQRRCDFLLRGGALSAVAIAGSNRIVNTAPIRLFEENVQINTGAIAMHLRLLTEAAYTLCKVPGLKNLQEKFCNNTTGPPGFSSKLKKVGKRERDEMEDRDDIEESHHTLPYSYDMIPMAISMRTGAMMYNDIGPVAIDSCNKGVGDAIGLELTEKDLPHLSLRFVGYHEKDRQTISIPVPTSRPKGQEYVEAGDPSFESAGVSRAHVSRALGREASSQDVEEFIASKQGARAMNGITGDLFAASTWLDHAVASLAERGLIRGDPDEPAVIALGNMVTCVDTRILEHASEKKIGTGWSLTKATPKTYDEERKQLIIKEANKQKGSSTCQKVKQQAKTARPGAMKIVTNQKIPGWSMPSSSSSQPEEEEDFDELLPKGMQLATPRRHT